MVQNVSLFAGYFIMNIHLTFTECNRRHTHSHTAFYHRRQWRSTLCRSTRLDENNIPIVRLILFSHSTDHAAEQSGCAKRMKNAGEFVASAFSVWDFMSTRDGSGWNVSEYIGICSVVPWNSSEVSNNIEKAEYWQNARANLFSDTIKSHRLRRTLGDQ